MPQKVPIRTRPIPGGEGEGLRAARGTGPTAGEAGFTVTNAVPAAMAMNAVIGKFVAGRLWCRSSWPWLPGAMLGGALLVLALVILPASPAGAFTSPHGNFTNDTAACGNCHTTHAGLAADILKQPTETQVCFYCHDGTGSTYNIKDEFSTATGNTTYHPVKDTEIAGAGLIKCSQCHNPHGDTKPGGGLYPRLLRASDGTSNYYEGPQFCLACHGAVDRQFSPTYYGNTAGDHANADASHYDTTRAVLLPASGTKVTCAVCHNRHATRAADSNRSLLGLVEEAVCYGCHNSAANSMSGRNIQQEFARTGSTHDITGAEGAKVECSSCHGPHTVSNAAIGANLARSDLSDPANTKKFFANPATPPPNVTKGDLTDFCLVCHGPLPPTTPARNTTQLVPYGILFPGKSFTNNARGWDKTDYKNSTHYTTAGMGCNACHEPHGSNYPTLWSRAEDTDTASGICLYCHDGTNASYPTAKNIKQDLTKTGSPSPDRYRHPTLYLSGKHLNTEDYSAVYSQGKRHAECTDCHDPHSEVPGSSGPPYPPGALKNVSGVQVTFGSTTWDTWQPYPNGPPMTLVNPINYQYELCFKCHSSYAWQDNPPTPGGSITQTDTPKEFNPNNPSYHAVAGESKMRTFTYNGQTYYYGKFVGTDSQGNPWTATSRLYCEDCHGSNSSGNKGPHGSDYWYILKAPWTRATGAEGIGGTGGRNTQNHLCFRCHDYNFYAAGVDGGSATVRSGFSRSGNYNLHKKHKERGCTACHAAVPHGWKKKALLTETTDPAPYSDSSYLRVNTWRASGAWNRSDCDHSVCG